MIPLRDIIPSQKTPVITYTIIALNAIVFFFELTLTEAEKHALFLTLGLVPAKFSNPQYSEAAGFIPEYYTFFTNIFLHGGWMHFIMNMWALWIFGDNVEDMMGHLKYFLFYILMGFIASLAHFIIHIQSQIPAIGASGALAGVMAAYMRLFPASRIVTLVPIFFYPMIFEIPAFFYIGFWFLTQLLSGAMTLPVRAEAVGIAFWAHIGGFAGGFITYRLFLEKNFKNK
ncbi:MAG: rhomboid family intramembrane serine protease [Spirochaetia bacterium]|nr:rhomboid family intramembrane serine protease [Spirochaetia bacterium]